MILAKYTMMVKDIVNDYYKGTSLSIDDKLKDVCEYIFDFDYPVIDVATKKRIEVAILKHYYYREIAFETIGEFKIKLNDRLNLIMGRYNSLYTKQDLSLSPYINSYLKEVGNNSSTSGVNNENWQTTSDTPRGILTDLKEGKYSSLATYTTNTDDTENSGNYERQVDSLSGMTYAEAFRNYYDNIISLDEELVNEFSDLFMVIW
jgi:hypothetical protein